MLWNYNRTSQQQSDIINRKWADNYHHSLIIINEHHHHQLYSVSYSSIPVLLFFYPLIFPYCVFRSLGYASMSNDMDTPLDNPVVPSLGRIQRAVVPHWRFNHKIGWLISEAG